MEVELVEEQEQNGQVHVILQLHFDNKGLNERTKLRKGNKTSLKVTEKSGFFCHFVFLFVKSIFPSR